MRIEQARSRSRLLFTAMAALLAAACQANNGDAARPPAAGDAVVESTHVDATPLVTAAATPTPASVEAPTTARAPVIAAAVLPDVLVHKSATCGCCGDWVEHLREAGFVVRVNETEAINPIKERLGVPYGKGSCHTAEVGGYVVEGHVPAPDIKRLLAERPTAKGLVLPGMPIGSPGMEVPDGTVQPYTVELVTADGRTVPYARHGG